MVRIRRFGVVRTSNVVALWTLVIGLIFLVPFAIIVAAAGEMTTTDQFGNTFTMSPGPLIGTFLIGIVFYAGFLWIFTAIGLLIYNLVAGVTGGVEMELVQPPVPAYAPGPAWGQPPASPAVGTPPGATYQPPGGYGQSQAAYAPTQGGGWGQPPTPPPSPPAAPHPAAEPPPMAERPSYDPAPRWDARASTPPDEERREPDRS